MTLLQAVVEWHLFEVNLARLPEGLLALLLLAGKELCDVGVMALGYVLVPALLHLIILHVVYIFHLNIIILLNLLKADFLKDFDKNHYHNIWMAAMIFDTFKDKATSSYYDSFCQSLTLKWSHGLFSCENAFLCTLCLGDMSFRLTIIEK